MKQIGCLHHIGCPNCIAGNTASTGSEQPPPQLPFTGQSRTASSGSSQAAISDQPATSQAAVGPASAGLGSSSSSSTRLGTASSNQPATSHAATGAPTAGVGSSSSSSSSTRLGTASEPTQLGGRSQAGRQCRLAQAFSQRLHAYSHNVVLDVIPCCSAHSTHPGCQGWDEMTNSMRHCLTHLCSVLFVTLSASYVMQGNLHGGRQLCAAV